MEPSQTATIEPQQSLETPELPPSNKKPINILYIIAIVVILVLVIIGSYFLTSKSKPQTTLLPSITPTPVDETANWKLYTGKTYSFRYPTEWPLVAMTPAPQCSSCIDSLFITPLYDPNSSDKNIAIILVDRGTTLSNSEYLNMYRTNKMYTDVKSTLIDGNEAVTYKLNGGIPPLPLIAYTTVKDGIRYEIRLEDSTETSKNRKFNIDSFNKLITTFKFLDQNQENLTWQTQTVQKVSWANQWKSFKLNYPTSWQYNIKKSDSSQQEFFVTSLTKGSTLIRIFQGSGDASNCNYPNEPRKEEGMVSLYKNYIEIPKTDGIIWRLAQLDPVQASTNYAVCENDRTPSPFLPYIGITSIGKIEVSDTTGTYSQQTFTEIQEILKRIEFID